ncbi:gas vesicle structural protein GvpA [Streptomyces sp. ME19-01-6]|uniref:gas vesicle structural protein GvpA n=1 Tax=Streptomyces sp. ME19-01-6 TaxID=3028686 RepID=UPI0029A414F7|nr:gas vesicle structural protein GvpA [Streptomyces sp. ME19-01-6]MDX3231560.1 gas vesicle structural protein GvpA [Streptomyces sp. ME19-01-6]
MTTVVPAQQTRSGGGTSGLYDVLELILDRGLVIDAFIRVSLVGIEILKIDVRVVVASVDTYLRFAEACNRLDLEAGPNKSAGLPELLDGATESAARSKTKGALSGAGQSVGQSVSKAAHSVADALRPAGGGEEGEEESQGRGRRPAARKAAAKKGEEGE